MSLIKDYLKEQLEQDEFELRHAIELVRLAEHRGEKENAEDFKIYKEFVEEEIRHKHEQLSKRR